MPRLLAITRAVSPGIARCELAFAPRRPIDHQRATVQHASYETALRDAGCAIERLPDADEHADGVFVEDTAVVLEEIAVITRPGAVSRQGETATTALALARYRPLATISAPGILDGGDVLVSGKTLFVGRSGRTNAEGFAQLRSIVTPLGYRTVAVEVRHCLHLKTAATLIDENLILLDEQRIDRRAFDDHHTTAVAPGEGEAANAVRVNGRVLLNAAAAQTGERLAARGIEVVMVENDELARAEGGLSCCSLIFSMAV